MKIKQILLGLGFALVFCAFANAQAANADSQDGSTEGQSSSQFQVTTITAGDMPALRSMWESSLKHVNDAIAINMQAVIDLQHKADLPNEVQFYGNAHSSLVYFGLDIQNNRNVYHLILNTPFTPELQSYLEGSDAQFDVMVCEDCLSEETLAQKVADLAQAFGNVGLTNTMGTDVFIQGLEVQSFATEFNASEAGGDVPEGLGISQQALDFLHELKQNGTFEGVPVGYSVDPNPNATVIDVTARTDSNPIVSGGQPIGQDPAVTAYCTGGFIVTDNTIAGISTAGHCDGQAVAYEGHLYQTSGYAPPSLGGVAWYGLNARVVSKFQSNFGVYTTVTGQAAPKLGKLYCKFGAVTGETCSTIYKANQCANAPYTGVWTCKLWSVYANVSEPGDSGGPWFDGSIAIGIHFGASDVDHIVRSLFSDMSSLEAAGAHLLIGAFGTPAV